MSDTEDTGTYQIKNDGPVQGLVAGDNTTVHMHFNDWDKIFQVIKNTAPSEYQKIQQFIIELREIGSCQERVENLKDTHNSLHHLETALNVFEAQIHMNVERGKDLDIGIIRYTWKRSVVIEIKRLSDFSEFEDLMRLQGDFEDSLNERSGDGKISDLAIDLLDTCRTHLFNIDDKLKKEISRLNKISYHVLRSIDDSPTLS